MKQKAQGRRKQKTTKEAEGGKQQKSEKGRWQGAVVP
jgi:hypothetical protein